MSCTIVDMRCKEVINMNTGHRLGFVCDVEIELPGGQVIAVVVPGPARFFGLFGREEDIIIPWDKITKIGEDIILVDMESEPRRHRRERKKGFSW